MCVWQWARLPAWIWHFTVAKCRDFWSTLWAFPHQNGPPCEEPEPEWSRPGYRNAALMFFLLSVKEDEIFRHTTPLFLLRSKSPLGPSGVNKGRCSKWYANWKEGEGRKKKGGAAQINSPTPHFRHFTSWKKISVFRGWKFGAKVCSSVQRFACTQTAQSPAHRGHDSLGVRGRSFPKDLSLDPAETIDTVVGNIGDVSKIGLNATRSCTRRIVLLDFSFFQRDNRWTGQKNQKIRKINQCAGQVALYRLTWWL